jgi:type VI secretion system secreted protein VgrG
VRGASNVFSLTPGHTFTISDAPSESFEGEWVVREVEHVWDDGPKGATSYSNRFHLLPKEQPFRPPASVPECDVPGPQVATVTGPAGEEIHTDAFGRIKVQFPLGSARQRGRHRLLLDPRGAAPLERLGGHPARRLGGGGRFRGR